ncbi:uncharacterized protein B0P05DRAFT_635414 [Gilbertella persicaria]|uniref:uncharacterized protein n=1 Tax=Gilbertella persicaria TaxID=101096 RepID=UPI0022210428|nr:uncharacterized protein B0P05DRAFT_635414 [Gilbertella persicaria]KAI8087700.1 hypothetical protein B0P05DRAFT_635414 [Gilbertella persicaria]
MDKTLIEYDKNLQDLERQREQLELVMQKMGQEWEESGAGIGWLGSLDLPTVDSVSSDTTNTPSTTVTETSLSELTNETVLDATISPSIPDTTSSKDDISHCNSPKSDLLTLSHQPLFTNILSQTTGPSPEYLQSLLNVNEALLAQSLANNTTHQSPSTPMLTPAEETNMFDNKINTLVITPDNQTPDDADSPSSDFQQNTPRDYMGNVNPETEMIVSPLASTRKQLNSSSNNASIRY